MDSSARKKTTLKERMKKIELQNRRLKHYMFCLVFALLGLVLMGATTGLNDGQFRKITAQKISIVDAAGKELMLIGTSDEGTGLKILNKAGEKVLSMGTNADERGTGMMVADKEGLPRFGFGMDDGLPSLAIADKNGKKILALGGDARGYGLVIMDENEVERAGVGFKEGNTGVAIYDDSGKYVRGMIRQSDGTHYSSYVDENGKEIIER
jgi:hypothetical protein